MYIEKIDIGSFGNLKNVSLTPGPGVNIIEGGNESGKSTIAAFIKFIFYGFDGKPERKLHVSFATDTAEGAITIFDGEKRYRIERRCTASGKEDCKIYDLETNRAEFQSEVPGEVFFGINSDVFVNTAFVRQLDGGKVNGRDIGEAAANILFSADESVNLQRILKKIDEARIQLLHKNQKGGRIFESNEKSSQLRIRLMEAKESNKEIIDLEGVSEDSKRLISENTEKIQSLKESILLYDAHVRRRKKRSIDLLRQNLEAEEKNLSELKEKYCIDGFVPSASYIAELKKNLQALEVLEARIESCRGALETANSGSFGDGTVEAEKIKATADRLGGRDVLDTSVKKHVVGKRKFAALSAMSAVLGVIIHVLSVLAFWRNDAVFSGVSIAAYVLAVLGVVIFAVISAAQGKKLRAICKEFGVKNAKELEALLNSAEAAINDGRAAFVAKILEEKSRTELEKGSVQAKIDSLCAKFGDNISPDTALNLAEEAASALHGGAVEVEKCRAAYESALAQYDGGDDDGIEAELQPLPEDFDFKAVKREYDFLTKATESLREKRHSGVGRLSALRARNENPAELAEKLNALEADIENMQERHDAYQLAYQALSDAGAGLRDTLSPRLSEYSGEVMGELTAGKYNSLGVDRDMELTFFPDGGNGMAVTRESKYMSAGTLDAAYISLRMALINLLCRKGLPPIVFDESFARFDDKRLTVTMSYLCETAEKKGMQMLVFTSADREARFIGDNRFERIEL